MRDPVAVIFAGFGDYDPVLISPDQSNRIESCLRALTGHPDSVQIFKGVEAFHGAQEDYWPMADSWESRYKPYVVRNGVLLIPVKGVLLHDFPYAIGSYATGYYYIQRALERGLKDVDVKGVAFVCDSPGGHVAGCFELCDKIYAARGEKPLAAFAHEHAYSAAYAIASAASDITVSRTGGVGSIGVVTMHISWEKALKEAGIEVSFIFGGKYKTEGNPYENLGEDAKKRIQRRIDDTYGVFISQVARNRNMKEATIRDTEALTFTAGEAVDRELADKIGPLDDALTAFCSSLKADEGEEEMTTQAKPEGVSQEDHAAAVAAAGAAAKKRIADIMGCDEAKERKALAESIAMNTDLPVDQAKALLASAPKEAAAAAAPAPKPTNAGDAGFSAAMAGADAANPGPGATDTNTADALDDEAKADAEADRILGSVFGKRRQEARAN